MAALVVLTGALIAAAFASLYREYWGPSAFAERYVEEVADADASAALAIPGVVPEYPDLEAAGRPLASEALLRSATLASEIDDVRAVGERTIIEDDREIVEVTVAYTLDGIPDETTYRVEQTGRSGLVPAWTFETSPLAIIDLTVRGAWQFAVEGFEIDKRQISPALLEADPLEPVSMLAFSPGVYDISVDTPAAVADPESVTAHGSLETVELDIQTRPSDELNELVQTKVEEFLDACAAQQVLQPDACPFGQAIEWGIAHPPAEWSIATYPQTALAPDGAHWRVTPTIGTAHLQIAVTDYFTGTLEQIDQDVPFTMVATVRVFDQGDVHIEIDSYGE